jgi:zinc finger protein
MERIENEKCPICTENKLTLVEDSIEIPYFGKVDIFSMSCNACGFKQSDVEAAEEKDPARYEFTAEKKDDLNVRVVRSSEGVISIPQLKMSMEPGVGAEGFVSNIESVILRFKKILENERDNSDDDETRKHAKNLLKKLWKVECGEMPLKIVIEDKTGNSAIISDKAKITKLKK